MSSIDASADFMALFRQMKYELPEERKQGNIGNIMKDIESRMKSEPGSFFHHPLEDFDKLITLDKDMWTFKRSLGNMTEEESIEAMLRRVESKYKKMSVEQRRLFEEIKHDKMTMEQMMASVKSFHQQERKKMIPDALKEMAALVVFQFVNVYMAWNGVSDAIDLDEYEITRINQEVEKIELLVNQFCGLQGQSSQDIRSAFKKLKRIKNLYRSTLRRINSLKVEINGETQRLGLQRDQSYRASMANFDRAATQAQGLWENWSDLPPMMKALQGVSAVFYAVLSCNDYQTSWRSQHSLKVLRNKLREVNRQQDILQDLLDQAEEAYEEMEDEMQKSLRI